MKARRSALPLPRYVLRKPLKGGWGHFFNVPMWARKSGCPMRNEPLGTDHEKAVERAEKVLLPAFDSWLASTKPTTEKTLAALGVEAIVATGTLDWLFDEYRADRRFTKLDARTKRNHEVGFRMVGGYILKDGRRLGALKLAAIDTALVDNLYDKLLIVKVTDANGNVVERERRTTVNHAMKTCRRAWKVASRRNPGRVPTINPFSAMGLQSSQRETPTATLGELKAFRAKAIEMGLPSLATAALIGWEWLQREKDIFTTFEVGHYRPRERPNSVRILHRKTLEENWSPLFDDKGVPLHPELMAELDAIKKDRIAGLMLRRDWDNTIPGRPIPRASRISAT